MPHCPCVVSKQTVAWTVVGPEIECKNGSVSPMIRAINAPRCYIHAFEGMMSIQVDLGMGMLWHVRGGAYAASTPWEFVVCLILAPNNRNALYLDLNGSFLLDSQAIYTRPLRQPCRTRVQAFFLMGS